MNRQGIVFISIDRIPTNSVIPVAAKNVVAVFDISVPDLVLWLIHPASLMDRPPVNHWLPPRSKVAREYQKNNNTRFVASRTEQRLLLNLFFLIIKVDFVVKGTLFCTATSILTDNYTAS